MKRMEKSPEKDLEARLEELRILAERDVGYHRRVRRRRTFSPGTEVQSQVRPGDREKVLEWLFEVRCLLINLYSTVIHPYIMHSVWLIWDSLKG